MLNTLIFANFFGIALLILARYLKVPGIVLLLIGGILLGPEVLGIIQPSSLDEVLPLIISLAVATILFEGGLTLDPHGFKNAKQMIVRLLSVGVVITWIGTALLMHFLLDFPLALSLLGGSLIIVTGPTVISPLLQRTKIRKNLHHILHWEGVLIDPIGIFIAILCFEWLKSEGSLFVHLGQFGIRVAAGICIGFIGGKFLSIILKKCWIPKDLSNIFVLASALGLFGLAEIILHETGLLSVVVAGLTLGWSQPPQLKHIKQFKLELTETAIGILFVLLAANLKIANFLQLSWQALILIAAVLLVIRPLGVFMSAWGTTLTSKERGFLSWVAPRGIVAGSMASLFSLELARRGDSSAVFLEVFTYSIIGATVIFQGLSFGLTARIFGVKEEKSRGWLIIGINLFSMKIAEFITRNSNEVCLLLDTNEDAINEAQKKGFNAFQADAVLQPTLPAEFSSSVGYVLALTDNRALNQLICEKWSEVVGEKSIYRWSSSHDEQFPSMPGSGITVWGDLPKPSKVSYDIKTREIAILQGDQQKVQRRVRATPLLGIDEENLLVFHSIDPTSENLKNVLFYQQRTFHLPHVIHQEEMLKLKDVDFEGLLRGLLTKAEEYLPQLKLEDLVTTMMDQERAFSTALSNDVAIPHTHCDALTEPLCVVAQVTDGVLHLDKQHRSKLFFMLLSPVSDPEIHLILLAEIAKLASEPTTANKLTGVKDISAAIQFLLEREKEI